MSREVIVSEVVVFPYVVRTDGKVRYVDWYYGYDGHDRDAADKKITPAEVIGRLADRLESLDERVNEIECKLSVLESPPRETPAAKLSTP